MNEKIKMLNGNLYNPADMELTKNREYAKKLCHKYNLLPQNKKNDKNIILTQLLGKIGKNILIESSFWCDYGYNIEVGDNFYSNHNLVILDPAKVKFGNNVLIGPNCGFYTAEHPLDTKTRNLGLEYAKEINVGNNVWFGGNVTVLGGVTIGDDVVIGAGSVVTKDIPPNTIAFGNPCKAKNK